MRKTNDFSLEQILSKKEKVKKGTNLGVYQYLNLQSETLKLYDDSDPKTTNINKPKTLNLSKKLNLM